MLNNHSKISVIKIGESDYDLMSVKALKTLQSADTIFYCSKIHLNLFEYTYLKGDRIFLGRNWDSNREDAIGKLIWEKAEKGTQVVILKEDSSINCFDDFDERSFEKKYKIPVTIIPGLNHCIAIPALQNISVTKRGTNESFIVTTLTNHKKLPSILKTATKTSATLIIKNGIDRLSEILELYKAEEKYSLPIAIIGKTQSTKMDFIVGSISSIEEMIDFRIPLSNPLIVIGEVVRQHAEFKNKVLEEVIVKNF